MQGEASIEDEKNRIEKALLDPATSPDTYCYMYAARQALAWVLDERIAAKPYDVIMDGKVQPLIRGTQEAQEGCPVAHHQQLS
jgi:hypothetical protein